MILNNTIIEKRIDITVISVSILFHLFLFLQFSDVSMMGKAAAPDFSDKISLNLLAPIKQLSQLVKLEYVVSKSDLKSEPSLKPIQKEKPKIINEFSEFVPELATAKIMSKKIERAHVDKLMLIKNHYLNNLLNHIETYKYYPQSARKRGVSGSIDVSFDLLNDGYINNLHASGRSMLLRKTAEQVIASALPFPAPPSDLNYPVQVSYAMQFKLN